MGEIPQDHDEVRTLNRNLIATYSHTWASGWGVTATLPFVGRDHLHHLDQNGVKVPEQWNFRELGEMQLTGRYQHSLEGPDTTPRMVAMVLGLKLPTGRTQVANAEGAPAERSP